MLGLQPLILAQADLSGSIDDEAFRQLPDLTAGLDLIDDDLPSNLDYLDATSGRRVKANERAPAESMRSWETEHDETASLEDSHFAAEVKGETIKILADGPVELIENYWDTLPVLKQGDEDG
jgi:autophagy-related protein 2